MYAGVHQPDLFLINFPKIPLVGQFSLFSSCDWEKSIHSMQSICGLQSAVDLRPIYCSKIF